MTILIVFVLLSLLVIFLLKPGKFSAAQLNILYGVNVAHRGLHTQDKSTPENSLPAFAAAAEHGYGIELDIQLSKDGEVVVFHDDALERVANVVGRVDAYTLQELQAMRLCNTEERIPLFTEVLNLVDARVPFIIELKTGPRNTELCEKARTLLRTYKGAYCIESFDPRIVRWFYKNAPDVLRGQLSSRASEFDNQPFILALALSNLLTNVFARPQFIAYGLGNKPMLARLAEHLGAIKVCWTARSSDVAQHLQIENDSVIFEFYRPENKFK